MKSNTQNKKIKAITETTLVIGIDVGSEIHYARAFNYRGIELSKKPYKDIMASYQKLLNGLYELGIHKMQEHLDYYIELVNAGEKSFSTALEELVEIEKKNNQILREYANVKTANFPFIKTMDDFDFDFQPNINKKELLELNNLGFLDKYENILFVGSSGVGKMLCYNYVISQQEMYISYFGRKKLINLCNKALELNLLLVHWEI